MKVPLKLFAAARQIVGQSQLEIELNPGASVADLRAELVRQFPALDQLIRHTRFAVDAEYAADDTILRADAEIACIPPVSGG